MNKKELLKELYEVRNAKKEILKKEAHIKDLISPFFLESSTNNIASDEYLAFLETRVRSQLDRDKVIAIVGADQYQECMSKTEYTVLEIKKLA